MSSARTILLALLCAGTLGLLAGCGGGDPETVTVVETTATAPGEDDVSGGEAADDDEDAAELDATVESDPALFETFRAPSGNIACLISDEGVRCDIAKRSWSAPRPAGCPGAMDYGQGLIVDDEDGPGAVVCAGDSVLDPSAPVLAYGDSVSIGDFTCASAQAGVTCRDDGDDRGFFISRQSYRLF